MGYEVTNGGHLDIEWSDVKMRTRKHTAIRLASLGMTVPLALSLATVVASSASAAPANVTCNGTIKDQTVGDVVVPDNGYCLIERSTVTGKISLGASANLLVFSSTVDGGVIPAMNPQRGYPASGYLNAWNSTFKAPVVLLKPWGAWLSESRFVSLETASCYRAPCYGGVTPAQSQVVLTRVNVSGLTALNMAASTIEDSTIGGKLDASSPVHQVPQSSTLIQRTTMGAMRLSSVDGVVCSSSVTGDTEVSRNSWTYAPLLPVTLGTSDGSCAGNHLGSLTVKNYANGKLTMNGNRVTGLASSTPGPSTMDPSGPQADVTLSGSGNRFTGGTGGAFTAFATAPGNSTQAAAVAKRRHDERAAKLRTQSGQIKKALKARAKSVRKTAEERGAVRLR